MRNILVTVVGPTAVGKTEASIQIAKYFQTEIISADARQFYREMNLGTAKPSAGQLDLLPHHFINHLSVKDVYSAGDFEKEALQKIDELFQDHDLVVMTGGSGLFIKAVLEGFNSFPKVNEVEERKLKEVLQTKGIGGLHELLKIHDPEYYKTVDLKNPQRMLRALAVSISSGRPYSTFKNDHRRPRNFVPLKIGLRLERNELYRRIDERVDRMMQDGLFAEVMSLREHWHENALQTVGYREFFSYDEKKDDLNSIVNLIKQHSRNYAKRQITWFNKDKEITWFHPLKTEEIISFIEKKIRNA